MCAIFVEYSHSYGFEALSIVIIGFIMMWDGSHHVIEMQVSTEVKLLIRDLLIRDPAKRLGSKCGAHEIKSHPFFRDIKWPLIRRMVCPVLPFLYDSNHSIKLQEPQTSTGLVAIWSNIHTLNELRCNIIWSFRNRRLLRSMPRWISRRSWQSRTTKVPSLSGTILRLRPLSVILSEHGNVSQSLPIVTIALAYK